MWPPLDRATMTPPATAATIMTAMTGSTHLRWVPCAVLASCFASVASGVNPVATTDASGSDFNSRLCPQSPQKASSLLRRPPQCEQYEAISDGASGQRLGSSTQDISRLGLESARRETHCRLAEADLGLGEGQAAETPPDRLMVDGSSEWIRRSERTPLLLFLRWGIRRLVCAG